MRRITSLAVWVFLVCTAVAAVLMPEYTPEQLQDVKFVRDEIDRMSKLREEVINQNQTATPLVQMTLKKDLQKLDVVLEALRYVESSGFRPDDPELNKLEYFQISKQPLESGFEHNMQSAGPPGGRVSYLDSKPTSRTRLKNTKKPPAKRPRSK